LQYLVMMELLPRINTHDARMLHFAPEKFLKPIFSQRFRRYETADLFMGGVDYKADLQQLPFEDQSYDLVYASHVLEHILNDSKAVRELRRILRPGGIAVLPVPIVSDRTIEYGEANPYEAGHVRAPGLDYFERYNACFARVEVYSSDQFPEKYQL